MRKAPCALINHLVPIVPTICLEPIKQSQRHSATLTGDYFHLAINLVLRVHAIQKKPQYEPKVLVRLRDFSSPHHAVRHGTIDNGCQEKTITKPELQSRRGLVRGCSPSARDL